MSNKILVDNDIIRLRPVLSSDILNIITLRNQENVKKWFYDNNSVTYEGTKSWILGMRFPYDVLLIIETHTGIFLGTIGWKYLSLKTKILDFGRLMVDKPVLKSFYLQNSISTRHIAMDAAMLVRNYAFETLNIDKAITSYIKGNNAAEVINLGIGMKIISETSLITVNGETVNIVQLEMKRSDFLNLRSFL